MTLELPVIARVAAALVVALLISFISTPVVKSIAQRVGAMDIPKDNRRMHHHPIPRMGGLAIFLGFLLSALIFVPMDQANRGMLLGAVVIVILGIFDDIYALPALPKLLVQIGEYKKGSDKDADDALSRIGAVNAFLRQGLDEKSSFDETLQALLKVVS